jgi:hypothetical protein
MNFRKQVDIKAKKQAPLAGSSKHCNEPSVQRNLEFAGNQQLNYCHFFSKKNPIPLGKFWLKFSVGHLFLSPRAIKLCAL